MFYVNGEAVIFPPLHFFAPSHFSFSLMLNSPETQWRTAASEGDLPTLQHLLSSPISFNMNSSSADEQGDTALHLACKRGHEKVVGFLLGLPGIEVNRKNYERSTPFSKACSLGNVGCVKVMLRDSRVKVGNDFEIILLIFFNFLMLCDFNLIHFFLISIYFLIFILFFFQILFFFFRL